MSYCPKSHYLAHPLLAVRTNGLVQLNAVDPNIVIHPLQLVEYIEFDSAVHRHDASVDQYVPASYPKFAAAYNASKGNNPCKFATKKKKSDASYNINSLSIPSSLTFPFANQRYHNLQVFGLITKEGDIDTNLWDMMKNALLRPHRDAMRFQA
ncbi:hypothetical protein C0993_000312 [Termitomyces sp. T159_Od127]|nr:hypothetical protein C0993_000312 [Termitomyces sp. T159_Od127]